MNRTPSLDSREDSFFLIAKRLLCICLVLTASANAESVSGLIRVTGPTELKFEELVHLAVDESPAPALAEHLRHLLFEPII